jgi:hypothetical protein
MSSDFIRFFGRSNCFSNNDPLSRPTTSNRQHGNSNANTGTPDLRQRNHAVNAAVPCSSSCVPVLHLASFPGSAHQSSGDLTARCIKSASRKSSRVARETKTSSRSIGPGGAFLTQSPPTGAATAKRPQRGLPHVVVPLGGPSSSHVLWAWLMTLAPMGDGAIRSETEL